MKNVPAKEKIVEEKKLGTSSVVAPQKVSIIFLFLLSLIGASKPIVRRINSSSFERNGVEKDKVACQRTSSL